VTSATLQASRELAANGIPLIAATARVPAGLASLRPEIPAFTAAVCCNGGLGVDMRNDRALWQQELRPAAVARIVSALISRLPDVGLAAFDGSGWNLTANYLAIRGRRPRAPSRLTSPAELAGAAALALSVCHPCMEAEQLAAELAEAGTTPDDAVLTYGDTRLLDIAPPGVDKASGVARVLEMLGVAPEQTVAFGDAPNDIPLFRLAGHAVAVANAHPEALALATTVTQSVLDDGFSRELQRLHLIPPGKPGGDDGPAGGRA